MDKEFKIFFEIYGKKLQTTISAKSEDKAKELIRSKIIFHKIIPSEPSQYDFDKCDNFDKFDIFGINGTKAFDDIMGKIFANKK